MSEDLISYWEKWIEGEEEIDLTIDGIILKYSMINKQNKDGVRDWVCFTSKEKLYSFIKYVLLPSIQISRTIGIKESEVYLDVCDYEKTINLLKAFKANNYEIAIEDYNRWLKELEGLENGDFNFDDIHSFIHKVSDEIDTREVVHLEVKLFENIKCVGRNLVKEYEDNNMLDVLETKFELSKDEIIWLFEAIDDNKFMIKRITTLLNEKFV
ncbi:MULTISPECIES: hypothetical protein [unclassified Clostridium]|uniref:hypothetical protein n=1 Tax=unclassified Clostridium TaxID=2614128 RepID=UPI000297FFA2|nr:MULTISPECIES: hypothetical protein [unclassified Clostridium]EKQ50140.1 MAG: hypothetical protein A370_05901 [Clostridium sp. Maddingley MBC34-26]